MLARIWLFKLLSYECPYAVIGDQSSGFKFRQRSYPYDFVVPGSSV